MIFAFKTNTAEMLHMLPDCGDDIDSAVEKVAKQISQEIKEIDIDRDSYYKHLNKDVCSRFQSDCLEKLLSKLCKKIRQKFTS